jgi:hypothetical protein
MHAEMSRKPPSPGISILVAAAKYLAVFIIPTSVQAPSNLRTSPRLPPLYPPKTENINIYYYTTYNL